MIRRDFLKLCALTAAAISTPRWRAESKYTLEEIPIEILLVSITARVLAQGASRPEDGEHGLIEFDAIATGIATWVIVNHLDTRERVACLTVGTNGEGEISFNSAQIIAGDTVRIQGLHRRRVGGEA